MSFNPQQITHHQRQFVLRLMGQADLDGVLAIEQDVQAHPWTRSHFESSLASSHQCFLLEYEDSITAYAITSTAADEAELLNITVSKKWQRQGLATRLLSLICETFDQRIQTLFLEVRESNHPAIALYDALYFNQVGMRPNYYPAVKQGNHKHHGPRENAIIMAKLLHC